MNLLQMRNQITFLIKVHLTIGDVANIWSIFRMDSLVGEEFIHTFEYFHAFFIVLIWLLLCIILE